MELKKRPRSRPSAPPRRPRRPAIGSRGGHQTAPRLSAPKEARARVDAWLGEIARTAAGKALKPLLAAPKAKLADLVASIAEGLALSVGSDPRRPRSLSSHCSRPIRSSISQRVIADVTQRRRRPPSDADAMRMLRRAKAEAALLIALADIGGVWPVERVTARAHRLRRCGARRARCATCCAAPPRRASSSSATPANPEEGSGYVVLAMGKMGAHELNYSSDIDLIVLYDADAALARGHRARRAASSASPAASSS